MRPKKVKESKDPLIVYWTVNAAQNRLTTMNLLWEPPQPLLASFPPKAIHNYVGCKAVSTHFRNSVIIKSPLTTTFSLENKVAVVDHDMWLMRDPSFQGHETIEFDHGWLFFSEESVVMEVTPPYMHRTRSQDFGYMVAGAYDISKWFRSILITLQLWEGVTRMELQKDDPILYLHFKTDRKVIFKQFELTPEIHQISLNTVAFKDTVPNLSLTELYERFTRSNRHKLLLKLIKENLLD